MASVSFSQNQDSIFVAYEDGAPLCSVNCPREEGLKWAYSLGPIPTRHVIVVGLGAGYHIMALADIDPTLKITIIDNRESLIPVFQSQFEYAQNDVEIIIIDRPEDILKTDLFQEVMLEQTFVLTYRECWGAQSKNFSEVFAHLTGRSLESLNYHLENFGFNIKAHGINPDKLISIKDVLPIVAEEKNEDVKKQAFRILGELVK